jgi:hypothetical protein
LLRKDIKALFRAIRSHDNGTVRSLLADEPRLLSVCATAPPKKDDGQSPLQVAFKAGNFEAAGLLLDLGADVNFHETSTVNNWTAPVLHDAIRAAIFSDDADAGLALLERLFQLGADPNATDSFGNSTLHRALLDARIRINHLPGFPQTIDDPDLKHKLERVFAALLRAGAKPDFVTTQSAPPSQFFADEPVMTHLLQMNPMRRR